MYILLTWFTFISVSKRISQLQFNFVDEMFVTVSCLLCSLTESLTFLMSSCCSSWISVSVSSNRKSHWIFKKPRFPLRVRYELHLNILPGWRKWHTDHIWGWSGSHSIKSQPGVNNICTAGLKIKPSQRAERSPQHTSSWNAKDDFFLCKEKHIHMWRPIRIKNDY